VLALSREQTSSLHTLREQLKEQETLVAVRDEQLHSIRAAAERDSTDLRRLQSVAVCCSLLQSVRTAAEGDSCNLRRSLFLSFSLSFSPSLSSFSLSRALSPSLCFFLSLSFSLSLACPCTCLHNVRAAQRDTLPTCEGASFHLFMCLLYFCIDFTSYCMSLDCRTSAGGCLP